MSAISLKVLAERVSEPLRQTLTARADQLILDFEHDHCPPPPPIPVYVPWPWRWPWPPPPWWANSLVSELVLAAYSLSEGTLREETLAVAGRIAEAAFGSKPSD